MWKLVEILLKAGLERFLKEQTPRERLSQTFVELYRAMISCHRAYVAYASNNQRKIIALRRLDSDRVNTNQLSAALAREEKLDQELLDAWGQTVMQLVDSIKTIEAVLDIHSPALLSVLDRYIGAESRVFVKSREELEGVPRDIASYLELSQPDQEFVFTADTDFEDDDDYKESLAALRQFMRDDLKLSPEELIVGG
jgi:hypothetical protein